MSDLSRRQLLRGVGGLAVLGFAAGCTTSVQGSPVPVPHPTPVAPPAPPDALALARKAGQVTMMAVADAKPFSYAGSSGVTGEAVEVAKAAFTAIGIPSVTIELTAYGDAQQKLAALSASGSDSIACFAGATIFDQTTCETTDPVPDFQYKIAFGVAKGNPKKITTMADVVQRKLSVAALPTTPLTQEMQAAGVTTIKQFPEPITALHAVLNGQADCFPFYDISLRQLAADNVVPGMEVTGVGDLPGAKPMIAGFQFIKRHDDDTSLRDAFATQLDAMRGNGQWAQIAGRFGLTDTNAVPQGYAVDQLCH